MTPSLPDLLLGQAAAISAPAPPEAAGDYLAARMGIVALIAVLAAQEAERGAAACAWENESLRTLFAEIDNDYADILSAAPVDDRRPQDLTLQGLDAENASLRHRLIALHEAVERRGDLDLDRRILALYQAMAEARRLDLPPFAT